MEDADIIDLYFARNEDAIRQTDISYGRRLNILAQRMLHSREDAEESVSDTYLAAWESIPPHRPLFFFAFLAAICRNLSLNKLDWKLAAKRRAEVVTLTEEMETCIPDSGYERTVTGKEIGNAMDAFLGGAAEGQPPHILAAVLVCGFHCRDCPAVWHDGEQGKNAAGENQRKAAHFS